MTRPTAPESETPETDALVNRGPAKDDGLTWTQYVKDIVEHARSLERRLSLAQTEIKGHMRIEDDLKAEIERERMRVVGCSVAALGNWKEGDSLHADYDCVAIRDVAKLRVKYDKAQSRIAELEKDAARYRWLRQWANRGDELAALNLKEPETPEDIDAAIDAALKDRA